MTIIKNKRYFKCPIEALYMMKNYGVQFSYARGKAKYDTYYDIDQDQLADFITGGIEDFRGVEAIYVAKESEGIFEPINSDYNAEGHLFNDDAAYWDEGNGEGHKHNSKNDEIMSRDGKQFFSGEVEND